MQKRGKTHAKTLRFCDACVVFCRKSDARKMQLVAFSWSDACGKKDARGITIVPNLTSVLKDKSIWKKPFQFYPEHFMDSEGNFVKNEVFIPFSAGRRICVGEPLARMNLFIFFTSLLQHFEFCIPDDQPFPRHDPVFTFSYNPHPFQVCCTER
ncbi:unnamed protein product [Ranitomeya imitator]|uniref:Cytochrome P450 n=1 Tax=Ranitomeya imitator TaxID=111125 RepID=A0ABN9KSX5_9NEOB|nr:unnamed protein product [Ranitomeya imitator]